VFCLISQPKTLGQIGEGEAGQKRNPGLGLCGRRGQKKKSWIKSVHIMTAGGVPCLAGRGIDISRTSMAIKTEHPCPERGKEENLVLLGRTTVHQESRGGITQF